MTQPEQLARENIDRLLTAAGWHVCEASAANIHAARGVAIREFPLPDYPSLEEKGAHLLYFLVKNHHFVDGNKRIAAALFLWFLEKNHALYRADGGKRIADNALVAMTLLIAESRPDEKDVLTRVVVNLINRKNA